MSYIYQHLKTTPYQPAIVFRTDTALDTPVLESPADDVNLCEDNLTFVKGSSTGIFLTWEAVTGATGYIVQWGNNSSFTGPTIKGRKVVPTQLELKFEDDIRNGEEIFWRVMAFNTTGGSSAKSETRSLVFDCEDRDGEGAADENEQETICNKFGVDLEIDGPTNVKCCSKNLYGLNFKRDCTDDTGTPINVVSVFWKIVQSGTNHAILEADQNIAVVASGPNKRETTEDLLSEKFTLRVTVGFKIGGEPPFFCFKDVDVTVDCDSDDEGLIRYIDSRYVGYSLSYYQGYETYDTPWLDPNTVYDRRENLLTVGFDDSPYRDYAIAIGPVFEVYQYSNLPKNTDYPAGYPNTYECAEFGGTTVLLVHEARVHLCLAGGAKFYDGCLKTDDIAFATINQVMIRLEQQVPAKVFRWVPSITPGEFNRDFTGEIMNIFDPGQIPSDIELNVDNVVTVARKPNLANVLVGFDCDETSPV